MDRFIKAMAKNGLNIDSILPDGKIHRFKTDGKDLSGWYVCFQYDKYIGGSFGDWRQGFTKDYSCVDKGLSEYELMTIKNNVKKAKEKADRERIKSQDISAKKAQEIWNKSKEVTNHAYLRNKNVKPYGIKEYNNLLIIPIKSFDKKIKSLQFIDKHGKKKFLPDGAISGNALMIPGNKNIIYICEGYSTGATIANITGNIVLCAFNAGNIYKVSKKVRELCPNSKIVIAGDNDRFLKKNIGLEKAKQAAISTNSLYVIPKFKNNEKKDTDFNDLFIREGESVVIEQLTEIGGNLIDDVRKYLKSTNGIITSNQLNNHFGLKNKHEKNEMINITNQLCEENILRKDRNKSFTYKIINVEAEIISMDSEPEYTKYKLPFDLDDFVHIPKKSIIVIAGESNSGKTAASLDCLYNNLLSGYTNQTYFSSEMGADEYKGRVLGIDRDIKKWEKVKFYNRNSDFNEVIVDEKKDGVVYIDFLEPLGEKGYAGMEEDITMIWESLNDGIAIINLQKNKGLDLARGGEGTKAKARLYLSISSCYKLSDGGWVNRCKVVKSKIPKKYMSDVDGMSCFFIASAKGIKLLTIWQYMTKADTKDFIEELKTLHPAAEMSNNPLLIK